MITTMKAEPPMIVSSPERCTVMFSARAVMKQIRKIGSNGIMYQTASCAIIVVVMLNQPVNKITRRIAAIRTSWS